MSAWDRAYVGQGSRGTQGHRAHLVEELVAAIDKPPNQKQHRNPDKDNGGNGEKCGENLSRVVVVGHAGIGETNRGY
jgi:hypothetical protein